MVNRMTLLVLYIMLIILNFADIYTTAIILDNGGVEANPLQAWAISTWGYVGMLYVKIMALLGILIIFWYPKRNGALVIMALANFFYACVVLWNVGVLDVLLSMNV